QASGRAVAAAHHDLARLELCAQHRQQVALVGFELGVGQHAAVGTQRQQQRARAQAWAFAQPAGQTAAASDLASRRAKAELEQLAEQRTLGLVEHVYAALGRELGWILVGKQRVEQPLAAVLVNRLPQRQQIAPALATVALEPA